MFISAAISIAMLDISVKSKFNSEGSNKGSVPSESEVCAFKMLHEIGWRSYRQLHRKYTHAVIATE
jgi:hypothetical protein